MNAENSDSADKNLKPDPDKAKTIKTEAPEQAAKEDNTGPKEGAAQNDADEKKTDDAKPEAAGSSSSPKTGDEEKKFKPRRHSDTRRERHLSYMARRDATELAESEQKKKTQQEKDLVGKRHFAEAVESIKATDVLYATGRRKTSSARVYMKLGSGKMSINNRSPEEYFPRQKLLVSIRQPLVKLGAEGKFDISVQVRSGGMSGQAGAIRHGIARVLAQYDEEKNLRRAGMVTRDPRAVERKKIGLHKARKRPQYSKR